MTSPREAADHAAEGVRALNHLTLRASGYRWPSDVAAVLAELHALAGRLPQALQQAADWLRDEELAGRIGHDQTTDAASVYHAVGACLASLTDAATASDALAAALNTAHNSAAHFTGHSPGSGQS